jgi:uncharacterized RDD family membrane protein YckC
MNEVEIFTHQYVPLQYQLASPTARIGAYLLDVLIQLFFWGLVFLLVEDASTIQIGWALATPFYSLLFEYLWHGQTPGKRLLGLQVISLAHGPAGLKAYFIRWLFKGIEVSATFGAVALAAVATSPRNQRFGDRIAGTLVVSVKPRRRLTLDQLLSLSRQAEDTAMQYPAAAHLTEKQALLIRQALQRWRNKPSLVNKQLVTELAERVRFHLDLPQPKALHPDTRFQEDKSFLESILKEYVLQSHSI